MSDTWDSAPLAPAAPAPTGTWDSAPLAGPSMQQKAVLSATDNGDEAAKALQIQKKTNIPATVVQSDLPGYDAHMREQSAIKAVQNPALAKYIDGNPMAARVSNDDYDKLDEVSQTLKALHPELIRSKAQGGVLAGISEIAELAKTDAGITKLTNALIALPYNLGKSVFDFIATPGKVATGEIPPGGEEAISFGLGVALGMGGPRGTLRVGRTGEAPKPGGEGYDDFDTFMSTLRGMKTREEIDAFIASKTPGPPGAMLQIEHAKAGSAALDKAVEVAQDSNTKARSPELFEEAAGADDPGVLHVDAKKIVELYQKEGKVPTEDDGLLGFVPGLAEKAQTAAVTGGEVTIPIAKYIAHVDPAVHEGLKDSIRLHDDGVTLEEAEGHKTSIEAYHGTPHDFEQFDLTKIGTGEGAQVYGHGLYFAENKAVGEEYQKNLSGDTRRVNNEVIDFNNPLHIAANQKQIYGNNAIPDMQKQIEVIEKNGENATVEKQALAILKSGKELPAVVEDKGSLYKVSIAADPTHFLDWDAPIGERERAVAEKIDLSLPVNAEITGADFYKMLVKKQQNDEASLSENQIKEKASKILAEVGIPGIKYLDEGSRGAIGTRFGNVEVKQADGMWNVYVDGGIENAFATKKEAENWAFGTRNFVVFDDRLVKITEKNGEPIAALLEAQAEIEKLSLGLDTRVFLNMVFEKGKSVGITETEFKKYSDLISKQEMTVLDKAVNFSKAEVARALKPEWKRNEAAVTTEVTEEFRTQGVFAAERYLRQNKIELGGDNIDQIADDLAPLWGFASGADLRNALTNLETVQAADRKSVLVQEREAIKAEVARRMEERYGNLAENIAKEARQIALSEHTFDILDKEVQILSTITGTAPTFTRAQMVDWAKRTFEASNIRDAANWQKHRRAVERGFRDTETALLKGDFQEAFQAKQRQQLAAEVAKQSNAFQQVIDSAEKKIDRFSSEETIPSINQAHLEQLRQMLASIGLPQQFAPLADTPSLRDFTDAAQGQIAVAPWLMDGTQPKLQDMSVGQFRDFVKSMQSLEHAGRDAMKLENAYGEALLENTVGDIVKSLERFPFIDQPAHPSMTQRAKSYGRTIMAAHLLVERALDYTDQFNPHGPLTEWLDRPLRDANSKEITLTEQVTKMFKELRPFVDNQINRPLENKLIPDALDKSGFLSMAGQDLRILMLYMGDWIRIKKIVEGYGVNEADIRRMIDQNATSNDVAWVNGVWKIFAHLKPEADAVQLKDTGVPIDSAPAIPWEVKGGKLTGGYFPLGYDKYNSDINSRIARPLFDKGYYAATTPHGYTEAVTEYKGAVDLTGAFLAAKVQGMIHDIAFRLPVRNANKLIEHQEFRTAMAQYWSKEVADLLPGWLRDIANSHNIDDTYARDFVRAAALIRQNVTSTLIAYNPSTFMKHGFTAAVMSIDRVGLSNLLSAAGDIGFKGAAKSLSDLVRQDKRVPDEQFMEAFRALIQEGERGNNARQFILDSSPVMRNRLRQYEDSIRGAVDAITAAGPAQTLAEFRQRQMQYGRLAVAFSDQMSAMPTWLAAYKKAYLSGESHADAVFIADKDVSRAHGSSFIGDKPLVMRTGNTPAGELVRWFTNLYGFWNHQVNNNFQLVWDANAAIRRAKNGPPELQGAGGGPPQLPGQDTVDFYKDGSGTWQYGPEPGANACRIAWRVAQVMAIIWIEENATAAKDEDHHGFLARIILSTIRYFGSQFVGLREITHGAAGGYEPTTGMIGTLWKAGSDTVKDIGKATGVKAGIAKKWIEHTATILGMATGIGGSQVGRTGQFGVNVASGRERPMTITDWRQGLRTGSMKARKH